MEAEIRGAFSSVEAAWQNIFELLAYASTIIFYRPEQLKWPVLIPVVAVACASSVFAVLVHRRRGHLLHLDVLTKLLGSRTGRQVEHERGFVILRQDSL